MKLATVQASAIKSTFEVLKDILNDVNIYFKPDGMYIVTLDTARTSLVDMYLASDNFEEYNCESEIIALSEAAKDVVHLRKFVRGLVPSISAEPTILSTDNKAARDLSYNPEHHGRSIF